MPSRSAISWKSYLAKYREATARDSIGAAAPDARIISTAVVSNTPSWPRKLPIVMVSALAMFALSAGFILSSALLGALPARANTAPVPPSRMLAPPPVIVTPSGEATFGELARMTSASVIPGQGKTASSAAEPEQAPAAAGDSIEALARDLGAAGEGARRITVVGASRNVGATMTAVSLARSLAKRGKVALVDLAFGAPNLSAIASDPAAPGIAELVRGEASFGQIITRDRHSRVHLIMAGLADLDTRAIMTAQRLAITLEALSRTYDHVVIDAGVVTEAVLDRLVSLAQRVVLVAAEVDDPAAIAAEQRLLDAGFAKVTVIVVGPNGPETTGDRVAA